MAHFILLRQRLKVIETIKKTTGAMRLISMSMHSRLRNQRSYIEAYNYEIKKLHALCTPPIDNLKSVQKNIVVLVGSQKGLCGKFNEQLFQFFEDEFKVSSTENIFFVPVGKYAIDYCKKRHLDTMLSYEKFFVTTFVAIVNDIMKHLETFESVQLFIFTNVSQTFFSQKPKKLILHHVRSLIDPDDQNGQLSVITQKLFIKAQLLHLLYESLLSEQATRFFTMDQAYRNAEDVLIQTKIDYNKMRQTYVTRELIELASGLVALE